MTDLVSPTTLDYTGERMVPGKADSATFWEHVYRYRFATRFVKNKRVLDIACGEGYGTAALLQAGARDVVGVDISAEACQHARLKYGIDARVGNAENIPLHSASRDVIVSFETIEHVNNPAGFLDECVRVLTPGGLIVLSTPNRNVYSEYGKHNSYHVQEWNQHELLTLLRPIFSSWKLYTQKPRTVNKWSTRSLAADSSEWAETRGFWRLRQLLRDTTCAHVWEENTYSSSTYSIVQLITSKDRPLESLVNPYMVREWQMHHEEQMRYMIVVARV